MKYYQYTIGLTFICALFVSGCGKEDTPTSDPDTFERKTILTQLADQLIIPGYKDFINTVTTHEESINFFIINPTEETLLAARLSYEDAYVSWQKVAPFSIGMGEEIDIVRFVNTYPADAVQIEENILSREFNLILPSSYAEQGFPAVDYLLYGSGDMEQDILANFQTDQAYGSYLKTIVNRIKELSAQVLEAWEGDQRTAFINNDGNSATASLDLFVNDYINHYERNIRAGKVGIPAGVFSSTPLPEKVEGFYHKDLSKRLFTTAIETSQKIFNGTSYINGTNGAGIADYLDYLRDIRGTQANLSEIINLQFSAIINATNGIDDSFYTQISNQNEDMLHLYDALQLNVINLKVDALQAMNISVDYVDSDGD